MIIQYTSLYSVSMETEDSDDDGDDDDVGGMFKVSSNTTKPRLSRVEVNGVDSSKFPIEGIRDINMDEVGTVGYSEQIIMPELTRYLIENAYLIDYEDFRWQSSLD